MIELEISRAIHDQNICAFIGQQLNQQAGGWSIGHRRERGNSSTVIIQLPDGVTTLPQLQAIVAAFVPDPPAEFYTPADIETFITSATNTADLKPVLRILLKGINGPIKK